MSLIITKYKPTNFTQYIADYKKYSRLEEIARKIPLLGRIIGYYFNHKKAQAFQLLSDGHSICVTEFNNQDTHVKTAALEILSQLALLFKPYEARLKTKSQAPARLNAPTPKTVEGFEREIDQALIEVFGPRSQSKNFRQTELPLYYCLSNTPDLEQAIPIAEKLYPGKKPIIDMEIDFKKALKLKAKLQDLALVLSKMPAPSRDEIKRNCATLEKAIAKLVLNRTQEAEQALEAKGASFALLLSYLPKCLKTHAHRSDEDQRLAVQIAFELSSLDDFPNVVNLIMGQLTNNREKFLDSFSQFMEKKRTGTMTPEDFLKQWKEASPVPSSSTGSLSPSTEEASSGSPPPVRNRATTPPRVVAGLPPRSARAPQPIMASPSQRRQAAFTTQETSHPALANFYTKIREILVNVFGKKEDDFYRGVFSTYLALTILLEDKNYSSQAAQELLTQQTKIHSLMSIDLKQVQQFKRELSSLSNAIKGYSSEAKTVIQGKYSSLEKAFSTRILEAVGIHRNVQAQGFYTTGRSMANHINDSMNGKGNPLLLPLSS